LSKEHLVYILDEQVSVGFTGKVNALDSKTSQMLGSIFMKDGKIIDCTYKGSQSVKAFFNLCIDEFDVKNLKYIVEPEIIDQRLETIHYPYSVLKRKIVEVIEKYRAAKLQKPPADLKILTEASFIASGEKVDATEFSLLKTLSDVNRVEDIYSKSPLIDYEITNALVSLRKKKALRVLKNKE
jgi:hypothetical protein